MHDIIPKFNTFQQILWLFFLIFTVVQEIHISICVDKAKRVVCFVWFLFGFLFFKHFSVFSVEEDLCDLSQLPMLISENGSLIFFFKSIWGDQLDVKLLIQHASSHGWQELNFLSVWVLTNGIWYRYVLSIYTYIHTKHTNANVDR